MKKLGLFVFLLLACALAQQFLPWWSGMVVIFLSFCFLNYTITAATILGGSVLTSLWMGMAFWLNISNMGVLASRIGVLFQGLSSIQIIMVTTLIASTGGALAGSAGSSIHHFFRSKKQ